MKVELTKLDAIPQTGTTIVPFFGKEVHVFFVNGLARAVANICMHLGGPLECRDGEFVCPWHGARFDIESGARIEGPSPKDARLMRLPTIVENGSLFYVWGEA